MKEVVKVSISGIAFTFDEDGYRVMKDYLKKLETGYAKHPDGREIIADIEARVAELILEYQESDRVIDEELARRIVGRMGYPDDMDSGEENPVEEFPRRFYRNPEGAKLAGICSGIGAYFRVDPVWIRLGIFAPVLLSAISFWSHGLAQFWGSLFGFIVLAYFILWIAVPMAKTPRQKLEMRGGKITADSIRQGFEDEAAAMNDSPRSRKNASVWADIMYVLGRILQIFIKVVVFFVAFVVGIVVLSLLIAVLAVLFGGTAALGGATLLAIPELAGISAAGYVALLLAVFLMPLFIFLYWLIKVIFSSRTNRSFLTVMWVIWAMILVWFIVMTVHNADRLRHGVKDTIEWFDDGHFEDRIDKWEDRMEEWEDALEDAWENGKRGSIRIDPDVTRIRRTDGGPLELDRRNGKKEVMVLPAGFGDAPDERGTPPEQGTENIATE